jgi:hypothetical protein
MVAAITSGQTKFDNCYYNLTLCQEDKDLSEQTFKKVTLYFRPLDFALNGSG